MAYTDINVIVNENISTLTGVLNATDGSNYQITINGTILQLLNYTNIIYGTITPSGNGNSGQDNLPMNFSGTFNSATPINTTTLNVLQGIAYDANGNPQAINFSYTMGGSPAPTNNTTGYMQFLVENFQTGTSYVLPQPNSYSGNLTLTNTNTKQNSINGITAIANIGTTLLSNLNFFSNLMGNAFSNVQNANLVNYQLNANLPGWISSIQSAYLAADKALFGYSSGALINVQYFYGSIYNPNPVTYVPTAGTNNIVIEVQGPGGQAFSDQSAPTMNLQAVTGGGGGGYTKKHFPMGPSLSFPSGIANYCQVFPASGYFGGPSTVSNTSTGTAHVVLQANQGGNGNPTPNVGITTPYSLVGGVGGTASGGDINISGQPAKNIFVSNLNPVFFNNGTVFSEAGSAMPNGGDSFMGFGGGGLIQGGEGPLNNVMPPVGYGGGAQGTIGSVNSYYANATGGDGIIIIWEYN